MAQQADLIFARVLSAQKGRRAVSEEGARCAMGLYGLLSLGATAGLVSALAGCYRAPGTARDQSIYISEEKEIAMGISAFHEVLRKARLSEDLDINEMVNRVGRRIAHVANKPEYEWEFAVIQDKRTVNAFALPGGKVAGAGTVTAPGAAEALAHPLPVTHVPLPATQRRQSSTLLLTLMLVHWVPS